MYLVLSTPVPVHDGHRIANGLRLSNSASIGAVIGQQNS